jgi:hypothetical protein
MTSGLWLPWITTHHLLGETRFVTPLSLSPSLSLWQMQTRSQLSRALFPISRVVVYDNRVEVTALRVRTTIAQNRPSGHHDMVAGTMDLSLMGLDEIEGVSLQHHMGYNVVITAFTYPALVQVLTADRFHVGLETLGDIHTYCHRVGNRLVRLRSAD